MIDRVEANVSGIQGEGKVVPPWARRWVQARTPWYATVLLFVSIILLAPLLLPSPYNLSFLIFLLLFHITADTETDA